MDMAINISIAVFKGQASPHPVQATKWDSDISSQYLRIPFEERAWYLSNASLSLDWRKNTSIGHRSTYLSRISRALKETCVLIKARRALGAWNASFG